MFSNRSVTIEFDGTDGRAFGPADTLLFDPPPTLPVPWMAHLLAADHTQQFLSWWQPVSLPD